jgi:hypothetical protein
VLGGEIGWGAWGRSLVGSIVKKKYIFQSTHTLVL